MHYSTSCFTLFSGLLLSASLCLSTSPAWAQNSAARVMAVSGDAKAVDAQGRTRQLEKGAELFAGDKVQTADASLVQVRMHDGGYLSVRANTEMVIDQFVYDEKDAGKSNFVMSLLRGGFRSITGLIGRSNPNGYQIRAATATIGIRGTDHEPVLVLDTPEAQLQTPSPPGLYDKVNDGETFITSKAGVLALKRGDVGFTPLSANVPPQVLLKIPDFYKIDLKTDARDPKDGGGGAEGKPGAGTQLRPSVAARREAQAQAQQQQAAGGTGTPPASGTNNAAPAQPSAPAGAGTSTAPSTPTAPGSTTATTKPAPTGTGTGTTTATTPVLTPEQKRAIVQTISPTAPKTTTPTPTPTQR